MAIVALATARAGSSADESATLLRVFLRDGTTLVSYGEPARVGDRIVFSMPTGALPNPPLHLVNLPLAKVDWDRTDRYASAARAAQYLQGQAELDYAALSNRLAGALNEIAETPDPARRLTIIERARATLVEWPQQHYSYRQADIRSMVGMLDEAIADLRAAQGARRFDLSLAAFAEAPAATEPLLPPPTVQEAIEQVLNAARVVDTAVERTSLLASALATLEAGKDQLPSAFVAATRNDLQAKLRDEQRTDRSYQALERSVLSAADRRASYADVLGVERLLARVQQGDEALGGRRPEAIASLVAAVQERLDAARRLRLARDRWALRAPAFAAYREAIAVPLALLTQLGPRLDAIKTLSGTLPETLASIDRVTARIQKLASAIVPPQELSAAHSQLMSATQLAANAATLRRDAILANDMERAWNASSAAAGALMLAARARSDIQAQLRPPQLR
jgi:hypothetical protein